MLLPLQQHECQFLARGFVRGSEGESLLQQQLGVEFRAGIGCHLRQQAQGLGVLAVDADVVADEVLGDLHLAVEELTAGQLDLARQGGELRRPGRRRCSRRSLDRLARYRSCKARQLSSRQEFRLTARSKATVAFTAFSGSRQKPSSSNRLPKGG